MCETIAEWQEEEKAHNTKPPLHVPQPSPLARHDNTACPSFFFSRPRQGKALVLLSTAKEKSALLKTCLFMETSRRLGEKTQSGGNADEKLLLRSV